MSNAGQQKKSKPLTPKPTQVLKPVAKPPTGMSSTKLSGAMQVKPQQSAQKKQAAPSKAASPKVTPHSTKPLTQKTLENAPTDVLKGFMGELKNLGNSVGLGGVSELKESWGGQLEDKKQRLNVSAAGQNLLQAQEVARLVKGQLDRSPTNPQLQAAYAKVKAQQKAAQAALNQAKLAPKQQTQAIINTVQSGHTGLLVGAAIADGLVGKTVGSVAKDGVFVGPKGKGTPPTPKNSPATVELALPGGGKVRVPAAGNKDNNVLKSEIPKELSKTEQEKGLGNGKTSTSAIRSDLEAQAKQLFKGDQGKQKQILANLSKFSDADIADLYTIRNIEAAGLKKVLSQTIKGDSRVVALQSIRGAAVRVKKGENVVLEPGPDTGYPEFDPNKMDVDLATRKNGKWDTSVQYYTPTETKNLGNIKKNILTKANDQLKNAVGERKVIEVDLKNVNSADFPHIEEYKLSIYEVKINFSDKTITYTKEGIK